MNTMSKRIVIDLTKCEGCEACTVDCGYFYTPQGDRGDRGIQALKEKATFGIVCRRCEHASCIESCPYEALERQPNGTIKRFNLRCVSCKLCTQGCPFGTIYPEMVGFYVSRCDDCIDSSTQPPPCVAGCVKGAIAFREVDEGEPGVYIVDDHLAAIAPKWVKEDV